MNSHPSAGARTPGSAEGERDRAEQNDRADDRVVNREDVGDEARGNDEQEQTQTDQDDLNAFP